MTSIIRRGRFYWLDYYHGGKRHRRSLHTERLGQAQDEAQKVLAALQVQDSGPLLEDFAKTYFEWARSTKPASAEREKQRWDKVSAFFKADGILTLKSITPLAVERLRSKLIEDGLAKATINRYLQLLRGMFYRAADWGLWSGPNPLRKIKFFREEHRIVGLDSGQVIALLKAAQEIAAKPKSRLQAVFPDLILFDLNTGLRKSELLNLRWADIKNNELNIRGKGDRSRRVPLNRIALDILARQWKSGPFVFDVPNRNRGGLFRRTTATISKKVDFPFHFHQLRHTFATSLLTKGVDIITIAEILGHSRSTVSLIYVHSSPERARQAVSLLDSGLV